MFRALLCALLVLNSVIASSVEIVVNWDRLGRTADAVPTYLDQVNPGTMSPNASIHDAVFSKVKDLRADRVRYLHWDPFALSFPEPEAPTPGCSAEEKVCMRLVMHGGYEIETLKATTRYAIDEGACKNACLDSITCEAAAWNVSASEPCLLYTKRSGYLVEMKGVSFWQKYETMAKTSWNFTAIDPYVLSYMKAASGHTKSTVFNWSPIPKWMIGPDGRLFDLSGKQLAEYYSRIISWYTKGGFVDEVGQRHVSNHTFDWRNWEVLNEVDNTFPGCNSLNKTEELSLECVRQYTVLYDTIVELLHRDHPQLKFTAISLAFPACPSELNWFSYFLNASNHRLPISANFPVYLSGVSHHWYSENSFLEKGSATFEGLRTNIDDVFTQTAQFLIQAAKIQRIVDDLAPHAHVSVNEIGILIWGAFNDAATLFETERWFLNLQAAQYAYAYAELARLGTGDMAASQLTGYPGNADSLSMLDWSSGAGSAWYYIVKMMIDAFGGEETTKSTVETLVDGIQSHSVIAAVNPTQCIASISPKPDALNKVGAVYAQAFEVRRRDIVMQGIAEDVRRLVLLVNTRNESAQISLKEAVRVEELVVDFHHGVRDTGYGRFPLVPEDGTVKIELGALAVAILVLEKPSMRAKASWNAYEPYAYV